MFIDFTFRAPFGSTAKRKEDTAMAPSNAMRHDERKAEMLLIRA